MQILSIAGYKFITLPQPEQWLSSFSTRFSHLKGTILLSMEGINLNLAGSEADIHGFKNFLLSCPEFSDMTFRESFTQVPPFKRFKVKIKKEIITFGQRNIHPDQRLAPRISPEMLKKWLDEMQDFTLLDTRNTYEIAYGTFKNATHLNTEDFSEFAQACHQLDDSKPIVMFCTGGIRCEKAALHLQQQGFDNVYQLEGGILNYFSTVGSDHYEGACFVFDERIALNHLLQPIENKD